MGLSFNLVSQFGLLTRFRQCFRQLEQLEQHVSRLTRPNTRSEKVDCQRLMQMVVDFIRRRNRGTHFASDDFLTRRDLELERAGFGKHSLEFSGKLRFFFMQIVLTQSLDTAPDFAHVLELEPLVVHVERTDRIIVGQQFQERTNRGYRSQVGGDRRIRQLIVTSHGAFEEVLCQFQRLTSDGLLTEIQAVVEGGFFQFEPKRTAGCAGDEQPGFIPIRNRPQR